MTVVTAQALQKLR